MPQNELEQDSFKYVWNLTYSSKFSIIHVFKNFISSIENDPYQLIAPIALVLVPQVPRPKREYHELVMLISQVYDKLKAKGLLKPLDLRPIPNPLPLRLNVNKRCAYHQGLSHETDSFPVESIEFVKNCFPFNMISNSAYLLALNVFISEIG